MLCSKGRWVAATLVLSCAWFGAAPGVRAARADDLDLEEDDSAAPKTGPQTTASDPFKDKPPLATIKPHAYTLAECLALAERNFPILWAARARLAGVHAQLDEAKFTPYSMWSATARFGILPQLGGTPFFNQVPRSVLNQNLADSEPFLQFTLSGNIPIYTFGKIETIQRAAEAQIRFTEWDLEKNRQQLRMDVRRAFFGLMAARDGLYLANDVREKLDKGIDSVAKRLADNDAEVDEADRLRLEIYRDELTAREAEAKKGATFAIAALRFLTGVQTAFDIPDEPLKRPETSLGPVVRYLAAARLFRADVNLARSGVVARRALLDHAKAQLFPNFGIGTGFFYAIAPSAVPQRAYFPDSYNSVGAAFMFGVDWPLDILPRNARVRFAESQLEEARAFERLALGGVAVEVENAYGAAIEANTREETWDRAEHRAKRWISSVQDAVDLGTKKERDMVEPLRAYVFARISHVQALMDCNITRSELARVSGWDASAPQS